MTCRTAFCFSGNAVDLYARSSQIESFQRYVLILQIIFVIFFSTPCKFGNITSNYMSTACFWIIPILSFISYPQNSTLYSQRLWLLRYINHSQETSIAIKT